MPKASNRSSRRAAVKNSRRLTSGEKKGQKITVSAITQTIVVATLSLLFLVYWFIFMNETERNVDTVTKGSLKGSDFIPLPAKVIIRPEAAVPVQRPQVEIQKSNRVSVKEAINKKAKRQPARVDEPKLPNYGLEPFIKVMPGEKAGTIRQDLRVILCDEKLNVSEVRSHESAAFAITRETSPTGYLAAKKVLRNLPLHTYLRESSDSSTYPLLEDTMAYIQRQSVCSNKPVFLSMASVGDELYWQLIENFVFTMVKFKTVECSLVICVSDTNCVKLCDQNKFPCYNFRSTVTPLPSVMEQIGELKLFHVPRALEKGVNMFMLDLDVGFLRDPMIMVNAFYATPNVDIFVQEDLIFIMNRTKAGWRTWFTQPLPNIGMFLCRGNNRTATAFSRAWRTYFKMEDSLAKMNPGKDQNHVLEGMRHGRAKNGLRYAYFSNDTAVLLDKMCLHKNISVELGGTAAEALFNAQRTIAVHTTCYEHTAKVLGLKATNAFWNPRYYDPWRPTITKPLLFISDFQVLEEVRSLIWLAIRTERSVIIPNLYGMTNAESPRKVHTAYGSQAMWPGFRVIYRRRDKQKRFLLKVELLEPAFYWRVNRDYDDVPDAKVVFFDPNNENLEAIRARVSALADQPRLVLHPSYAAERRAIYSPRNKRDVSGGVEAKSPLVETEIQIEERVKAWAYDSVGIFKLSYASELARYIQLPSVKDLDRDRNPMILDTLSGLRPCKDVFLQSLGNGTCFQICN